MLKVNRFDQRERLGSTSKSPRWVIAYKFEKYEATTRLNDIRVQVGKTGAITPVADLEPVELAGTTVSRASLHNADEIERKDVRVGDVVVVEKAGKIIPHIVRVEKHLRKGSLRKFVFPTECPECGTQAGQGRGGRLHPLPEPRVPRPSSRSGSATSPAATPWTSRGWATSWSINWSARGWCKATATSTGSTASDRLLNLERMGQKSSENLLAGIEASKDRGLARLLNALSIRHVGARVAAVLAERFGSMDALLAASVEQLSEINEIGPIIAQSVYDFLHGDFGRRRSTTSAALGVNMESAAAGAKPAHARWTARRWSSPAR